MVVLAARLAGGRAGGELAETTRERVRGPSLAQSALLDEALLGDLACLTSSVSRSRAALATRSDELAEISLEKGAPSDYETNRPGAMDSVRSM